MLTLLVIIRIRFWAGWRQAWWGGWNRSRRVLFVSIMGTCCLGSLDTLHPSSVAVSLVMCLCLALANEQHMFTWNIWSDSLVYVFCSQHCFCHILDWHSYSLTTPISSNSIPIFLSYLFPCLKKNTYALSQHRHVKFRKVGHNLCRVKENSWSRQRA